MKSENNLEELDMGFKEWDKVFLSDIMDIIGGGTPKTTVEGYWNGHINWISVKDFNGGRKYITNTEKTITELGLNKSSTKLLQKKDIIISARGTVGALGMISKPMAFNQSCYGLRAKSHINSDFLFYLLKNSILVLQNNTHGSVFNTITRTTFDTIEVKVPPLNEQKAIADILSSLDDKIELNNQMNETLEEMAQALFKRWFVDFEFPNEEGKPYKSSGGEMVESELGMIPKGWDIKKIIDISKQIGSGGTPSRKKVEYYGDEVLWLKTKELDDTYKFDTEEKITSIGLKESSAKIYPRNTIMIAMYGATVGKLGIISKELSFNQATCGIIVNDELPSHEYLFQWLKYNRDSIINLATGSAQQNLSVSVIKNIQLLCPNKNIVMLYKSLIESIFKYKEKNQYQNSSLKKLRDSLLPKLMSGEIRVSDLKS